MDPESTFDDAFDWMITITTKGGNNKKVEVTDPTLLQALNAVGDGINALARHAVAAALNANELNVPYEFEKGDIRNLVQGVVDNPETMETVKDLLDGFNNAGCSINGKN